MTSLDDSDDSARRQLQKARTLCQHALDEIDQSGSCLEEGARLQGVIDSLGEKIGMNGHPNNSAERPEQL
jgi:hypothetical protein